MLRGNSRQKEVWQVKGIAPYFSMKISLELYFPVKEKCKRKQKALKTKCNWKIPQLCI